MTDDFKRGYDKAYELAKGNTYSYDSTKRLFELEALYKGYNLESLEFKRGFVACVYALFVC